MSEEPVHCDNVLLYGLMFIGGGFFMSIMTLLIYFNNVGYPPEVYEVLQRYNYVPSSNTYYLILAEISLGLFIIGLLVFVPGFLHDIKFNYVENKIVRKWNENNKIGTCVKFTNKNEIPAFGKTITDAYIYSVMGTCVDVRDDEKDGKYTQDYVCRVKTLKLCDKDK